ncbi:hypothetical protein AB0O22_15895 [Streptomyces sp. NPDC091204]|uniref:hypothetical protein n=1 Tax=Streptomyces sp. NPDC091204 TaxID=3155299 RepID=UPI00342E9B5E
MRWRTRTAAAVTALPAVVAPASPAGAAEDLPHAGSTGVGVHNAYDKAKETGRLGDAVHRPGRLAAGHPDLDTAAFPAVHRAEAGDPRTRCADVSLSPRRPRSPGSGGSPELPVPRPLSPARRYGAGGGDRT